MYEKTNIHRSNSHSNIKKLSPGNVKGIPSDKK